MTRAIVPNTSASELRISASNVAAIETYIRQLHGTDPQLQLQAAQALGTLWLYLPDRSRGETLRAAFELGAWDALLDALNSGLDAAELEDTVVVSLAQLLVPPGSSARPLSSPLVRRLLSERIAGDGYTLGQLAAVMLSSSGGSRGGVMESDRFVCGYCDLSDSLPSN